LGVLLKPGGAQPKLEDHSRNDRQKRLHPRSSVASFLPECREFLMCVDKAGLNTGRASVGRLPKMFQLDIAKPKIKASDDVIIAPHLDT
jgi:hypothetical protein